MFTAQTKNTGNFISIGQIQPPDQTFFWLLLLFALLLLIVLAALFSSLQIC